MEYKPWRAFLSNVVGISFSLGWYWVDNGQSRTLVSKMRVSHIVNSSPLTYCFKIPADSASFTFMALEVNFQ